MATTDQAGTEQCRALTDDGGRCSRPAQEDGFCYQHDESDPTVDEQETDDETADSGGDQGEESGDQGAEQSGDEGGEQSADEGGEQSADEGAEQSADEGGEGSTAEGDQTASEEAPDESDSTILDVRRTVEGTATGLIGQQLDSVTEVTATEDGWRAIVEVIERSSVPDTQDILGQYEIELSDAIKVQGYRRIDRYRRSDTDK